ncbi:MAG: ThuA domain-containing protein [Pirellulaceae bacterium]
MVGFRIILVIISVMFNATLTRADSEQEPANQSPETPVQMLVPGFSVVELPVQLPNINNVRYRADGKLIALGYNGNIWLLSDSDGDGFEDTASLFFDNQGRLRGPIGMAVIPAGHELLKPHKPLDNPSDTATAAPNGLNAKRPAGVVVASKGKVSAILDMDGDGVADEERIIADGWQEIPPNVDAIGVAIAADGAIYFGLGTAAYNNAYLIDDDGRSQYDLQSERGTILRIEPDLSQRSIVCTGVRFTIGIGFDEHGELFATDQEGATWLPNGNPLDELLHIRTRGGESKQHFGFPPSHPTHLPNVFDEPSLFNYAPQHQSTCGMAFNLPRQFSLSNEKNPNLQQAAQFGPADWRGNVFVTGESRGKLWRTELARTERGQYIARNHLIACLSMLTVDCCISPRGDLIVACHSGGPDWGTGPTGEGKLYAIRYSDQQAPLPIAAWATGPQEVKVTFDRPLDPSQLKSLAGQTSISGGEFVSTGDRFETIRPGYQVVKRQMEAVPDNLTVYGVNVTPDRQTLVITTSPHRSAVQYAITLPTLSNTSDAKQVSGEYPQRPQIDVAYSLNGVLATWKPDDKTQPSWSGVLPHFELDICRKFSTSDDDGLQRILNEKGVLTLQTQLDLRNLLHPAVQPGAKLEHTWPDDPVYVDFGTRGSQRLAWTIGKELHSQSLGEDDSDISTLRFSSLSDSLPLVELQIRTGQSATVANEIGWRRSEDDTETRELPLASFLLPWAETNPKTDALPQQSAIPELAGGSWGRGRRVFHSEDAGCAKCHAVHGTGGAIGPDLTNLIDRDYASVLRDLTQPSYAINPDYLTSSVLLKDGRILIGAFRTDGDKLLIGDKDGRLHTVAQGDVAELRHSPLSIMPEGIPQKLGTERMRDLLTFLLTEPPHMPNDSTLTPPKPRSRAEVAQVLKNSEASNADQRPLQILLVAGAKDHGPGEHDYPAWLLMWSELMRGADGVTVDTAVEWPSPEQFSAADTIVFFQKGRWNAERAQAIDAHLAQGRGLVYIHWAIEGGSEAPAFAQRIGLASNSAQTQYRHGELDLIFPSLGLDSQANHPIGRNLDKVHFHDESYWQLLGDPSKLSIIATGIEDGQSRPLFWTIEPPTSDSKQRDSKRAGRVFASVLGHYSWTFDDPLFRILLLRGIAWSVHEPVDRFNELATLGIKFAD